MSEDPLIAAQTPPAAPGPAAECTDGKVPSERASENAADKEKGAYSEDANVTSENHDSSNGANKKKTPEHAGETKNLDDLRTTIYVTAVQAAEEAEFEECDESEPYKSKYNARKILQDACENLRAASHDIHAQRDMAMLEIRIGINMYLTEENTDGERSIRSGAEFLEGADVWPMLANSFDSDDARPDQDAISAKEVGKEPMAFERNLDLLHLDDGALLQLVSGYNYLSILWSHRAEGASRAIKYLRRARALAENRFGSENDLQEYTSTLFFLAQVEAAIGNAEESANLCVQTLHRQRNFEHSYDAFTWSKHALGISAFYVQQGETRLAAHCICAAGRAIDEISENEQSGEEYELLRADLQRSRGDLYAQILRRASLLRRIEMAHDEFDAVDREGLLSDAWLESSKQKHFELNMTLDNREKEDIDLPAIQDVLSFESARDLFNIANTCFAQSKRFYVLDGYVTIHLQILRSQSDLYNYLSVFEPDHKRFIAMHTRREKLLAGLLDELNPEVYLKEHQEISFELGNIARIILDEQDKTENVDRSSKEMRGLSMSPGLIKKVNQWAMKVIKYYSHFCTMFEQAEAKDKQQGDEETSEEFSVPYLNANFWIMHAYRMMVPPDPRSIPARILFLKEQLKYAERIKVLAGERLSPDAQAFSQEKKLCEELAELLPLQIAQLSNMQSN
mmetsp:Transcript_13750/g.26644  ORF Transcript_13750/g.26644 Transcript_13750/m.26644 type:complete len:682 (+) Transcript_13750:99-2144(+)